MKKRIFYRLAATVLCLTMLMASLTSCLDFGGGKVDIQKNETTDFTELSVLDQLFRAYSLFDLDEEELMVAILKGYIEGTGDKYAEYFTAEEYEKFSSENQGEVVGIGVSVIQNAELGYIEVINVVPDSPALEAGVQPSDYVIAVGKGDDVKYVSDIGYTNAIDLLLGEEGSYAEFIVLRDGEQIEFSSKRTKVTSVSVM